MMFQKALHLEKEANVSQHKLPQKNCSQPAAMHLTITNRKGEVYKHIVGPHYANFSLAKTPLEEGGNCLIILTRCDDVEYWMRMKGSSNVIAIWH